MQYKHAQTADFEREQKAQYSIIRPVLTRLLESDASTEQKQAAIDTALLLYEMDFGTSAILAAIFRPIPDQKSQNETEQEALGLAKSVQRLEQILERNYSKIPAETLIKIVLASATDIRSLIVQIAQHLNELRFSKQGPAENQKAQQALEVFVPICHKLGLNKIRWELEDLVMKQLEPQAYAELKLQINEKLEQREKRLERLENAIQLLLGKHHARATVRGRIKNIYRIHRKMIQQNKTYNEIHDTIAVRIITETTQECYQALGWIQTEYKEIENSFTDYVLKPKPNGYQSIHLDIWWEEKPAEIQIRTWEMHKEAEDGLSAHWEYKQYQRDHKIDPKLSVAKQISDWASHGTNRERMESLRIQFEKNEVYAFTPKNEVIELVDGATPIDFAFAVHTQLGQKCEKAIVNGKIVPLDYKISNGDVVEILTSEKQTPKRSWLSFVQTDKAKNKIRGILQMVLEPIRKKTMAKPVAPISKRQHGHLRLAKCCSPLPGDEVTGIKTTKRKIIVHRSDCPNVQKIGKDKQFPVSETHFPKQPYQCEIHVRATNKAGVLASILNQFSQQKCKVISTHATSKANQFSCRFILHIEKATELEKLLDKIRKIQGVQEASRH